MRNTLLALLAVLALAFQSPMAFAQEEEGIFEGDDYTGIYEDDAAFGNDWYYDDFDLADDDVGIGDGGWYDNEYYSGYYDDDYGNDWFFDTYDDPGDEGLFDV